MMDGKETTYLMETEDGMLVRVPASKLGQFEPKSREPSERARRQAEKMADWLLEKYGPARRS